MHSRFGWMGTCCRQILKGAAIAARGWRGYARQVHRHSLHRWSIVVLLIARLVLGEFANAMPRHADLGEIEAGVAAQTDSMPCPDHAASSPASEAPTDFADLADKPHDSTVHETHCCNGACDCACVHASALAMPAAAVNMVALEKHLASAAALGHTPHRTFLLFRPPA